ncbi:MAG TPA: hypothetical protein PKJ63_00495 [Cyclobacteriaceae bacterium]|nr:hypothetical protein [Cyclobacteriaceae bacterium]
MKTKAIYIVLVTIAGLWSCRQGGNTTEKTSFTKVDSLTETYLTLQDSLLHAWNMMAWDEKEKIKSLHNLIHLMHNEEGFDEDQLATLEQRLEQLDRIRYTQKSLANAFVIEEYDFASNSLVSEIVSLVESDPNFIAKEKVQKYVDKVIMADQRVPELRSDYDRIAMRFNEFLENNKRYLKEIDQDYSGEKKALFSSITE